MTISPAQCRGARGLLAMSQTALASASGVSLRTLQHFELGQRQPIPATLAVVRAALEAAGIEFISENGGGAGVRLRKPPGRTV
jgi:DNA-binding transcriptional regulator YiaG